jgi:riboflavin kinase/FMN adenylyltransferase
MEQIAAIRPERVFRNPVVTIGNFDGVHLGHQKIFKELAVRARALGGESVVYTFQPHPSTVLYPHRAQPRITTDEERARLIESCGIDVLVCAPFSRRFSRISAREFVESILYSGLGAKEVLVGYDYAFGRGREGDQALLREIGSNLGFKVTVVSPVVLDGEIVSSSRIRQYIQEGEVKKANAMLGREFTVEGTVGSGRSRGRGLGYPTANLVVQRELVPGTGIYVVSVRMAGGQKVFGGMASLGTNPTFGDGQWSFEVHILDFDGDLYGRTLGVAFLERLRGQKKFASPQALVEQIRRDEERARAILQGKP